MWSVLCMPYSLQMTLHKNICQKIVSLFSLVTPTKPQSRSGDRAGELCQAHLWSSGPGPGSGVGWVPSRWGFGATLSLLPVATSFPLYPFSGGWVGEIRFLQWLGGFSSGSEVSLLQNSLMYLQKVHLSSQLKGEWLKALSRDAVPSLAADISTDQNHFIDIYIEEWCSG